ncbi:hypothetical protein ACOMHN_013967 [Nucella lapillus]
MTLSDRIPVVCVFTLLYGVLLVRACQGEGSQLFHVNCTGPEASSENRSVTVSHIKERCSDITVNLDPLVSTVWLCPTKICDSCLHVLHSTEVTKVKVAAQGDDLGMTYPEQEAGFMQGVFIVSVNAWSEGARTTLWLSNLFTPSFSESFIPLAENDTETILTVDGVGQNGSLAFRYATCRTVHPPCPQNVTNNSTRPTNPTSTVESQVLFNADTSPTQGLNEDTSSPPPTLTALISAVVVLAVLLIASSSLILVLIYRRHLGAKREISSEVDLSFPRSESSEHMVGPMRTNRGLSFSKPRSESLEHMVGPLRTNRGLSFSNPSFVPQSAPRSGSFISDGEDTDPVVTEATGTVSHSSAYGAFYIDVNP